MSIQFTPPPTYAAVVLYDENAQDVKQLLRSVRFNPIWLKWFVDVAQFITQSGGGGGGGPVTDVTAMAPITSSGGTTSNIAISGAALTKTDDTNVTLTLGGTPATGLVKAIALTLGWTGLLSTARGGTGNNSGNAATVTTNANLTGTTVTSAGNATTFNAAPITNSLTGDVNLNNTANYFDGPSVAQGAVGTWFASGSVVVVAGAAANNIHAKLWDGTTVIASCTATIPATFTCTFALSGKLATPAGNLRISCRDTTATDGKILFNSTGLSMDSTITAFRVAD